MIEEEKTLPAMTSDDPQRILFYTYDKLDRKYVIWNLHKNTDDRQIDIAKFVGCSVTTVCKTLHDLERIGTDEDIAEYFKMAYDLYDIFATDGINPDYYLFNLLNSLLKAGINKREKVWVMTPEEYQEFCKTKGMTHAGVTAQVALWKYHTYLKNPTKENKS